MYYSWLLLCVVSLSVFSNTNAAPVHKRGILPSNINIDIKLGKQNNVAKNVETPPGVHRTVLTAPFGLASLTITTSKKNCSDTGSPSHHHGCHHKPAPPPSSAVAPTIPKVEEKVEVPIIPPSPSTTESYEDIVGDVFNNPTTTTTNAPAKVDKQTGEGNIDVRISKA